MAESLEREIRDLRALLFSERDPEGRGFAPLADALRRAGDLGQALELVQEGVGRLPDFATGHVVSGWIHRARGEDEEAEASFRRVLELDEENVSALRGLGFLLADRGFTFEALEVFRRLDELDPGDLEVQARLLELGEVEDLDATREVVPSSDEIVPIAALAPDADAGPVVDIRDLAPTAPEPHPPLATAAVGATPDDGPVVDIRDLAPDPMQVAAPTDVPGSEPAPEVGTAEAGRAEVGEEGPEAAEGPDQGADVVPLVGPDLEEVTEGLRAVDTHDDEGPVTRTMAELYVRQGLTDRAIRIYRRLVEADPGAEGVRARLDELEAFHEVDTGIEALDEATAASVEVDGEAGAAEDDEDLEDLARHMATGPEMVDEPEGPFAWGGASGLEDDEGGAEAATGAPVSEYFASLLAWEPSAAAGEGDGRHGDAPGSDPSEKKGDAAEGGPPPAGGP